MKKRNEKLVSVILSVFLAASLVTGISPASIKAQQPNTSNSIDATKQALIDNIKKQAQLGKSKYEALNENAPLKKDNPDEQVRVIVQLQDKPAAEKQNKSVTISGANTADSVKTIDNAIDSVKASQQSIIGKVKTLTGASIKKSFGYLVNGFSLEVKRSEISKIQAISGVKSVTEEQVYTPDMYFAKNLTQAYSAWSDLGYKGEGMVIAIIDTGIDYTHKDMTITDTSKDKLNAANVAAMGGKGKFFTDKVPYGYNFADNNTDVIDANTSEQHGMHVAGIVAANGKQSDVSSFKAVQGVAPEAQLLAMKVFSNTTGKMGNCYDDDTIAAIEDSVLHGADIINMSLGSSNGFQDASSPLQAAVKNATDKGVLCVVAAGNSALSVSSDTNAVPQNNTFGTTDTSTVSSPSTAKDALSVASYENTDMVLSAMDYTAGSATGEIKCAVGSGNPESVINKPTSIVDCGMGSYLDFMGKDLTGKVALIKRGDNTFSEKASYAQDAGAIGAIIYNKDGLNDTVAMAIDSYIKIPVVSIGNADGIKLQGLIANNVQIAFTGKLVSTPNSLANDMSPFSSWGPTPSLDFKPEISAPGGNIYSTQNNNKYTNLSGTSMAAPNTSGSEALIIEAAKKNLGLSGRELVEYAKNTVINTAKVEMNKNNTSVPYSPRQQGSGLIQIKDAINNSVIVTDDNGSSAVALKEIGNTDTFNLNLKNYGTTDAAYSLENGGVLSEQITDNSGNFSEYSISGSTMSFDKSTIVVPAKSTAKVAVTITVPKDFNKDKFVEGFIKFDSKDSKMPSLSVPYIGYYGSWSDESILDAPAWDSNSKIGQECLVQDTFFGAYVYGKGVDENGKTVFDPNNIAFSPRPEMSGMFNVTPELSLLRNAKTLDVDVVDKNDGTEKVLRKLSTDIGVSKDLISQVGDGGYQIYRKAAWDGTFYNKSTGKYDIAADGQYYIRVTAKVDMANAKPQILYMPVKIDTVAPEVNITSKPASDGKNTYTVTWTVSDNDTPANLFGSKADILLNGGISLTKQTINYNASAGEYSCTIDIDPNQQNDVQVRLSDFAGNMVTKDIILDSDVHFDYTLYEGMKINKSALQSDGTYNVKGIVDSNVGKLTINGVTASIDKDLNFSANITLNEGLNEVKVAAFDKSGNPINTISSYKVYLYTKAPVLTITSPALNGSAIYKTTESSITITGNVKTEDPSLGFSVQGSGNDRYDAQCDPTTGNFTITGPVSGFTPLTISAYDDANNITSMQLYIIGAYDKSQLKITFDQFNDYAGEVSLNAYSAKNDTYTVSGGVNHNPKVFTINGTPIKISETMQFSQDFKLAQGANKFVIHAEDTDGTITNETYRVTYDSIAPVVTMNSPIVQSDGKIYTNQDSVELKGNVYDNTYGFNFSINDSYTLSSNKYPLLGPANIKDIDYTLPVKNGDIITLAATDLLSNSITKQIPVVVDKVAPKAPVVSLSATAMTNKSITASITADTSDNDVAKLEYSFDKNTWTTYTTPVTIDKNQTLYARATDKAGNVSELAKLDITNIDKTSPVINITGVEEGKIYYNEVTPNITASDTQSTVTNTSLLDGKAYDGSKITAIGKHTLTVNAADAAGNTIAKAVSFTIQAKDVITNSDPDVIEKTINDSINATASSGGGTVLVDLSSNPNAVIPKSVLDNLKGKDVTLSITVPSADKLTSVVWTINGKDITGDTKDITLSLNKTADNADAINKIDNNALILSFSSKNGVLPGKAKVQITAPWLQGKSKVFLYYYNQATKKAEINKSIDNQDGSFNVVNGTVTITISHCSDYFLSTSAPNSDNKINLMPNTGSMINLENLVGLGSIIILLGVIIIFKRKRNPQQ